MPYGITIGAKMRATYISPMIAYDEKASTEERKAIREFVATTLKP